jgi:NMD protein affecting ribosome stability and mRNA decay
LASRKENYKLVGQDKGGKKKYRITILLRLPRYSIGDFIVVEGNPCLVLSMGSGGLSCFDLVERDQFTINPKSVKWRSIEYLAPSTDRREFMIVSHVFGQPVQIMDNETFEMAEINENLFGDEIPVGSTIHVLVLEDSRYFPLPAERTES